MLRSKELRAKAWESLKGKYWMAVLVSFVMGIIDSIGSGMITSASNIVDALTRIDSADITGDIAAGIMVLLIVALGLTLIGFIISVFVGSPVTVGLCNYFIKNTNSTPSFADAFSGFKVKYGRNVGTLLLISIKVFLWMLLLIVPGVIKSFEYAIIPYILADDPEISSKDAFKKAKEMMRGNKWRLFKLEISFIGWALLCIPTFGIGAFFLVPYMEAAMAEFYMELKNK